MAKMDDFLEAFSSKLNPEPAEPLICPQKLNLEHTEPPKNQTEPRTELGLTQH